MLFCNIIISDQRQGDRENLCWGGKQFFRVVDVHYCHVSLFRQTLIMRSTLSVFLFVELIYNEVVAYQKNNEAINGPAQ